jgi:predicted house-cleaning noncanonical NTP pyrophosphatase (MazG superfamily)
MKTVIYNKLVRDRIPEYIKRKGIVSETSIIPNNKRLPLLLAKLTEEADEATTAKPEKLAEELADILEVIEAIASHANIAWEQISEIKKQKNEERGGFNNGIFLISTTEQDKTNE